MLIVALLAAPVMVSAQSATTLKIPLKEKSFFGGSRELQLEATLFPATVAGTAPLLIFNHGSTGRGRGSPTETLTYPEVARFFVERGVTVLIPMRRGRGASGGDYLERYDCDTGALSAGLDRAIEDILLPRSVSVWASAVYAFLRRIGLGSSG